MAYDSGLFHEYCIDQMNKQQRMIDLINKIPSEHVTVDKIIQRERAEAKLLVYENLRKEEYDGAFQS